MSPARTVGLIAKREISTRLFAKGTIWGTAVTVVVLVAGVFLASFLVNRNAEEEPDPVAVAAEVTDLGTILGVIASAGDNPIEIVPVADSDAARAAVESGNAVAGLAGSASSPEMFTTSDTPGSLYSMVQTAAGQAVLNQAIVELGGDPNEVTQQVAQVQLNVTDVGEEEAGVFDLASYIVSFAVLGLMFYLIMQTGQQIASGVVEEKTSRIVEILLATIRPWQLLAGKILGIGLVGFIQVFIMLIAAVGAALATGLLDQIDVPMNAVLGWSVVWLFIGFLLFSTLWGGTAALVSRQEDIGAAIAPLMILLFLPFYAAMFVVVYDPAGLTSQIMTYIPFFAPFAVPVRVAYDAISTGEILISLALCLVAIVACTWLAGKLYQRGVLHIGTRLKLGQALRSAKG